MASRRRREAMATANDRQRRIIGNAWMRWGEERQMGFLRDIGYTGSARRKNETLTYHFLALQIN